MDRVTLSSLMGNIVVIGLDGEIRTLEEGQLPQPGELIIDEVSDTSELVIEQVTPQGSSINVTDDITALIEAIASGEDPTELGEEFDSAAGEGNGSSPQNTGAIDRTGAELLASTNFETVGTDGTGFSSTQVETLLDIFQIQPPEPTAISVPATVIVQEISSPTVNEGDLVSFDVTLNQPTEDNINITFSLFDQTATGGSTDESGSDYVNESVLITFSDDTTEEISVDDNGIFTVSVPLGENGFTVSLDSINDSIFEGPETFTLSGNTEEQSTPATGIATIVDDGSGPGLSPDDDRPTVTMSDAGTINEGELVSFKVSLSNPSATDVEVELSLNLGDTEAGDLGTLEYNTGSGWVTVPNDGVVTVPGGQTEFDVRIASINDAVFEGPEDFSVTVTGIGAVQGSDTGTATIVDDSSGPGPAPDDDRPSVAITDAGTINEGETANFKVTLSNASESTVQVELGLNLGDTEAGDLGTLEYNTGSGWVTVPNDGVVTVPAGQTEFDVRIASIDDAVFEGPEDFSVTVTGIGAVQGSDTGTATIVDDGTGPGPDPDDDRPNVTITDAGIINEGETANFKVTLSNASEAETQVELGLNLGDTEVGDLGTLEYNTGSGWVAVPNDGVVTVPAGQTEFDVRIASIDDAVYEGPEDFSVTVTGIGAVQGSDTGTATIMDDSSGPGPDPDDDRPSVTITDAGTINEGETANFKVTLSNASEAETQVELGLNLGDTEAGDLGILEYNTGSGWVTVPNDGVVTVPAGQTEFDVRIASIDDAVYEGPEDFSVTVTGIGAVQGSDTGTATIVDDGSGPGPDPDDDRPSVTITDAGTINEGDTANFKVTLSNASESSVQVELGLNLGDTEAGDLGTLEYNTGSGWVTVPNDGVVTVPAGQTQFDVRIASIDDAVYEGPEDFSVTVTGIGAVQGSDTGTATIVDDGSGPGPDPDDDRPSVTITDAGTINEGDTANFKVTLSNASESSVQVELGLNLGDTEAGDLGTLEYNTGSGWVTVPNDGVVTVPAGQTQFDVRIASIDDAVYEGPEDFSVTVTGIGAVQGSDTGTATIVDDSSGPGPAPDDDRPSVAITDAGTINEGETANFKVTLSNASEAETQVELGLNLGDTEAGDLGTLEYNTGSGWVTVPNDGVVTVPGGQTEFDVRIASIDDAVFEGPEDFSVTVTGIGAVQGSDTGTATIVDDSSGPGPAPDDDRPSVAITDAGTINEGETANFKVTLSNASEAETQVELGLNLGDTEAGDLGTLEYNTGSGWVTVPNDGVVTVPGGQTEFDVRIASIDDAVFEGPEDFSVTVTGIGAVQGSDTGTATIVDDGTGPGPDPDDDRPNVTITDVGIINEGETANFKVTLSNASEAETQVELGLNLGDTEVGDLGTLEYNTGSGWVTVPNDGVVTVPAGQTEFDVRIASIDDAVYEGPEDFSVTVTGIGAVQGSDTGTATIVDDGTGPGPDPDDDRPNVYIVEDSVGVNEGTDAVYTVRLSAAADIDVTVRLNTSTDGSNTAEADDIGSFVVTLADGVTVVNANSDGTYTIPAGENELKVTVPTTDDGVYEGDETFTVAVQGDTGVLGSDSALGIIYDGGNGPGPDPDDDRPTVSISDAGIVDEGDIATFIVSLSNASEGTVQVQLTLNPDETEVDDLGSLEYNTGAGWVAVPVDGIVTVPAMLTEFDVRIATIDDEVYEGLEDFSVTVTGLGAVQGTDTGLATIVDDGTKTDDDRPTVSISDAGTIDEGSFATFTVSLSNASEAALQVQLTLNLDETEVGDLGTLEYNTGSGWVSVPVSGIVTVPAGMTEFDLRIESIDDGVYEGPEDFSVTVTGLGAVQGSDTGLATIVDNSPPTARDFIISLDVQNGIFPVQDVEFDGITTSGEQRVEDLEDDAVTANDDDILIQVVSLPEHGELYYVDGNGQEVIIDETTQFPENTEVKYRLTEDFFEEQSFDSADLLEEQGKDILVGSYTPPNSNLTFTGGQIITIGNSIIFDSDAQISVDFANQQVGLVVVSPNETGQGDEISTGEYITLELDEDLSANEAKLNLASLNDRFNSGGAWLTAYIFLNGALVDVQQFYSTDITYTSNHEGSITVALANGSFDEIRLTPETDSASDKAGFTLVGTEITSFTDVNDDFTYQAIDTDGAVSNEATVAVDFENVTVDAVTALGYQTMALNSDLNLVMGTDGDDILVGTEGNDLIIGGLGNDILTGGEGDDVFKWTEMQSATDTVTDFSDGDQLDFTDVFDDMSGTDISALLDDLGSGDYRGSVDDISVEVTESGGNSTLTINKDGQQLEVNFDGASAADIANSLISNLDQLRE
ncbi:Calx-beta domain-containing protein [Vibrio sp. M60_M70]|uniref:Calx-beta domain-containing protein n=1 Tax=Vibrio sp. M60_M70 TaxID=3035166 RepID=UPI00301CB80E